MPAVGPRTRREPIAAVGRIPELDLALFGAQPIVIGHAGLSANGDLFTADPFRESPASTRRSAR